MSSHTPTDTRSNRMTDTEVTAGDGSAVTSEVGEEAHLLFLDPTRCARNRARSMKYGIPMSAQLPRLGSSSHSSSPPTNPAGEHVHSDPPESQMIHNQR